MTETADLSSRLKAMGRLHVLDLHQAAFVRGMLQPWHHDGVYYILPPEGVKSAALQKLFDEFKEKDELHLSYNAQSDLDIVHKPILTFDRFADRFFGSPPNGVLKVTAVARQKVAELNAVIDDLKLPFDPTTFPGIGHLAVAQFKPPQPEHQTVVSFRLVGGQWKELSQLEDELKCHLAECCLSREILVTRHVVKGLEAEITLASTEAVTETGNGFLVSLGEYLDANPPLMSEEETAADQQHATERQGVGASAFVVREKGREEAELAAGDLYRTALETLGATLDGTKGFEGLHRTVSGTTLLVEFKPGFLRLGHFGNAQDRALRTVYGGVRQTYRLERGWSAHYRYDRGTCVLSIRVGAENERAPTGWKALASPRPSTHP